MNRPALQIFFASAALCACPSGLRSAVPGDEHWDSQFGPVGVNDVAQAVVVHDGVIYAGGSFTAAGNAKASCIARFDGTNWSGLGNGAQGDPGSLWISALASDGTNLYAGGRFTKVDGLITGATNIAEWNGTSWTALGSGIGGYVYCISLQGSNLFAGGTITAAGGANANGIARWNGANWLALGSGVSGALGGGPSVVAAITFQGTNLYAGGNFTNAGGASASCVARWDGNGWNALSSGLNGPVNALLFYNGLLYAGGSFTNSGLLMTNLARWDGASWSAVPAGSDRPVRDLSTDGTNLFVSGEFSRVGGTAANGIARFNGSSWLALGTGLQGFPVSTNSPGGYKMAWRSNQLFVAGVFNVAGSAGASYIAGWDGANWFGLGGTKSKGLTHATGNGRCLLVSGTNLYVGGDFTEAGDLPANRIAKWDGSKWSPLGSGLTGTLPPGFGSGARALTLYNGDLCVGGAFTNAGGTSAKGVAVWDGSSWSTLNDGMDASVLALTVYGGDLYAGGAFTNADGSFMPGVARWDGFFWNDVGSGVHGGTATVNALAADATYLYAGGNFGVAGFNMVGNIARWNNVQWTALGGGVSGTVSALAVAGGGILYAGGSFTNAGGTPANRIAKWNGSQWSALGAGLSGTNSSTSVSAIVVRGSDLYVAGDFINAGNVFAPGIAKWNGTNWSALGSGLSSSYGIGTGSAVTFLNNDLYVGGGFNFAGDKPAMFISRWNDASNFYPTPQLRLVNPAALRNGQFRFRIAGTSGESYVIQAGTNLNSWTPLLTNSIPLYDFTDVNAAGFSARNYRALLGP